MCCEQGGEGLCHLRQGKGTGALGGGGEAEVPSCAPAWQTEFQVCPLVTGPTGLGWMLPGKFLLPGLFSAVTTCRGWGWGLLSQ